MGAPRLNACWDRLPGVEISVKFPSATDPEVALYSRGDGERARLCSVDQALVEKRSGLAVNGSITEASDTAEGEARLLTVRRGTDRRRITFSADKTRNIRQFNEDLRERTVAPHVAIDGIFGRSASHVR